MEIKDTILYTTACTSILLTILCYKIFFLSRYLVPILFLFGQEFAASRYVSTSVETKPSGSFSWLTGDKSSQLPPLTLPLPGVEIPPPLPDVASPGTTKITTLPNGVKIASEFSPV